MVFHPLLDYEHLLQTLIDRKLIENIARKQTRSTSLCWEDAAQIAYEKLWRQAKSGYFRSGSDEDFFRWATRVSYFAIVDYLRSQCRLEQYCRLDDLIPGTSVAWQDTLIDDFDALDACERSDRILAVSEIVFEFDQKYPKREYLKIWQKLIQDKTQTQIAEELKTTLPEVSKRWKKLRQHIAIAYVQRQTTPFSQCDRQRSEQRW